MTIKELIKNLALFGASLLFSFLLLETLVRILPESLTGRYETIRSVHDPDTAFLRKPIASEQSQSHCFDVSVSINSEGFRDDEWGGEQGGIAILGDSFTEAIQVANGEEFAKLLEENLGVNVYNFGISSYGTISQLELYKKYVRQRSPDLVVVAFFGGNDVLDNYCPFNEGLNGSVTKTCGVLNQAGELQINKNFYQFLGNGRIKEFVKNYCAVCVLLKRSSDLFILKDIVVLDSKQSELVNHDIALKITEKAILELKSLVEKDGAELLFLLIPEDTGVTESIKLLLTLNEVDYIDTSPELGAYAKKYNLPEPGMEFHCDGHWNPIAHYVTAQILANYINESYEGFNAPVLRLLSSPDVILDSHEFSQIFEKGVYTSH